MIQHKNQKLIRKGVSTVNNQQLYLQKSVLLMNQKYLLYLLNYSENNIYILQTKFFKIMKSKSFKISRLIIFKINLRIKKVKK